MAIRTRRGNNSQFDKNKLLTGEQALVIDKGELWFCYGPGQSKLLMTAEDLQNKLNASPNAYAALQQLITDLNNNPSELTNILSNISALQTGKLDKTGDSKDNTVTFTEAATLTNIATGESHTTITGKIKKFLSWIGTITLTTTAQTISGAINELVSGKFNKSDIIQTTAVNDANKVPSSAVSYSLAQSIQTLNDNLAKVGTVYSSTITSVPAVASGWTQMHSIAVPNGVYVVTVGLEYAGTISGRVILGVGNAISENQTGYNGINGGYTIRCTVIVTVTGGTIKLGCYCGSAFTPSSAVITAVRLI